MYQILRLVLKLTVLLVAYLIVLLIYVVPYAWLVAVIIGIVLLCKRTSRLTAMGTARWADTHELDGLIDE